VTVAVLGDVMADVVAAASGPLARGSDTPARVRFSGGGQGANVAAWLGALGAPVAFVGRVGDDVAGREAVAALAALGVDVRVAIDPVRPTGCCVVVVEPDGERTMLPDPGANDAPAELPPGLLGAGDHLHVAGYALLREGSRPGALAALEMARAAGATTSLDPSSAALLDRGSFGGLRLDLLRANLDELRALTGGDDPAGLCTLAREVVVTLGAGGAVWTDGAREERVAAEPAEVVDTTGAGDAFVAGLLAARARGAAPREALAAGCRAAARAVAQVGGRP
jgi:sugar/nucleoside kinase (ribokinase family)